MFTTLQAYRAVAAIMVVLYHADAFMWRSASAFHYNLTPLFDFFDSGVQLFFVLSGFIILKAHRGDLGRKERAASFYAKRALRIYPAYIVVTLLLIGLYSVFPLWNAHANLDAGNIATSIFLIPSGPQPILAPAWTLKHEAFFYLIFSLLIWNRRQGLAVFLAWQAGCLVNLAVGDHTFPFGFFFSANNLLFLFGMVAAALADRAAVRYPAALFALGLVVLAATGLHRDYFPVELPLSAYVIGYGLAGAMIVAGLVELERNLKIRAPAALCALGDASYAIYLVHCPILSLGVKILIATGAAGALAPAASFAALAGLAIASGLAFHVAAEKPLTSALKARFLGSGGRPVSPAPGAAIAAGSANLVSELTGRPK